MASTSGLPSGRPIRAVWSGKVAHAGWFRGFGNLLILDHGDGMFSLMAHLDQLQKALGDTVHAGEEVGTVGDTGSLKGPYLYFELRDGQHPLDPEPWLKAQPQGGRPAGGRERRGGEMKRFSPALRVRHAGRLLGGARRPRPRRTRRARTGSSTSSATCSR